jgi:hypothetical protein
MAIQIQIRRDTTANWTSNNPVLAQGEIGLNLDLNLIKIGDGVSNWNSLQYYSNLTDIQSLTANWENTYITVQANSANYDLAYHTILTGGDIGGNLNLTGYLSADSIRFNLGAGITAPAIGELSWDAIDETLHIGLNNEVTTRLSQDVLMRVKAGETIKRGQVVYASGAAGAGSGNIIASLFSAVSGGIDELYTLGIATEDLATNDFGFVSTFGKVKDISVADTRAIDDPEYSLAANSGWAIGTILYPSAVQAGRLTQTPPAAPNRDIPLAMIIATNGNQRTFFIRYEHGYHVDELHDVRTVGVKAEGDVLTWNNSVSAWENRAGTEPIFTTWAQSNSARYDSAYTIVNTNSSKYESVFSTVYSNSATWGLDSQTLSFNENTARLSISNGNDISLSALSSGPISLPYLPLSGGTLTGAVSTNQDIEITDYTKGIILNSPSSIKYRVTVSDAGELITTQV